MYVVCGVLFIPMVTLLVVGLRASLTWPIRGDGPLFVYCGYLMDRLGMVPVRDFYTGHMLGSHVAYRWIYRVFGESTMGLRIADASLVLTAMLLLGWLIAPLGRRVAFGASLTFGLFHYYYLRTDSLEREYLALIPLLLAMVFATRWPNCAPRSRWLMTGIMCGALYTLKPFLAIGGIALLGYLIVDRDTVEMTPPRQSVRYAARIVAWFGAGFIVPFFWMLGYCLYYGILSEFLRVSSTYMVFASDFDLWNRALEPSERIPYLVSVTLSWRPWILFQMAVGVVAGVGLFLYSGSSRSHCRLAYLILCMQFLYMVYPVFESRFSRYHYVAFLLFCSIWIGYCLREWPSGTHLHIRILGIVLGVYLVSGLFYTSIYQIREMPTELTAPLARRERIASWLSARLKPNDSIQAIESGLCGINHAALLVGGKPATRVVWGNALYSHLSHPMTQALRSAFIKELSAAKPRFVIRSNMDSEFAWGQDCSTCFLELDEFLQRDYFIALESRDFSIWESMSSLTAEADMAKRKEYLESSKNEDRIESNVPYFRVAR